MKSMVFGVALVGVIGGGNGVAFADGAEINTGELCSYDWQCRNGELCIDNICASPGCGDDVPPGTIRWENGDLQVCTDQGWADIVLRVPRAIDDFSGDLGPDLSHEGYVQCYGWLNDGVEPGLDYLALREACGEGMDLVFAGYRAGEPTLVRHNVRLTLPLESFLPVPVPSETTFYHLFDPESRFTWAVTGNWLLLAVQGNNWSDPGRLWEPHINGGSDSHSGHVLSQYGQNANDQRAEVGDRYFIYYKHTP